MHVAFSVTKIPTSSSKHQFDSPLDLILVVHNYTPKIHITPPYAICFPVSATVLLWAYRSANYHRSPTLLPTARDEQDGAVDEDGGD